MKYPLNVRSEIGDLRTVLLKRPGKELENLTPEYLEVLLFDDIPFLPAIQKEHDYFATTLRNRGVEVLYLDNLVTESLLNDEIRLNLIEEFMNESNVNETASNELIKEYLVSLPKDQLVSTLMHGIRKNELTRSGKKHLHELLEDLDPFYLYPLPSCLRYKRPYNL